MGRGKIILSSSFTSTHMFKLKLLAIIILGIVCLSPIAQAKDLEATLTICDIKIAGNSCGSNLVITNNTGKTISPVALQVEVEQATVPYDGVGFDFDYFVNSQWFDATYDNGKYSFPSFEIAPGVNNTELRIMTDVALVPDSYTFKLTLESEDDEQVSIAIIGGGGGGTGYYYQPPADEEKIEEEEEWVKEEEEVVGAEEEIIDAPYIDTYDERVPLGEYSTPISTNNACYINIATTVSQEDENCAPCNHWYKKLFWALLILLMLLLALMYWSDKGKPIIQPNNKKQA